MSERIKPAPTISFPASGVPKTRASLRTEDTVAIGDTPRVILRTGVGAGERVRIYRRDWS